MLTPRTIRTQFRRRAAEIAAAREVRLYGAAAACRAMQTLNWYGKDNPAWAETIYQVKNALVQHLYLTFGARVIEHPQRKRCWGPALPYGDGFAGCPGPSCEKCRGTGKYRSAMLYLFLFDIAGSRFFWHQPADAVGYPVQTQESVDVQPSSYASPNNYVAPSLWQAEVMYATVCIYLRREEAAVPVRHGIRLVDALASDLAKCRLRVAGWVSSWRGWRAGESGS